MKKCKVIIQVMLDPSKGDKTKSLPFEVEADFNEWLEKTTFKKIFLKDKGQDLMKLWISESGEILNANDKCVTIIASHTPIIC